MMNHPTDDAMGHRSFLMLMIAGLVACIVSTWAIAAVVSLVFHVKIADLLTISIGIAIGNAIGFSVRNLRHIC